VLNKYV
jgi:hypothetical protein